MMHLAPWPHYDEETIAAVADVLRSGRVNYWTGEQIVAFEQEFADFCGMPHALGVANGTVALELALIAAGIGPGDEVIVPARSFVATAGCVVNRGARPVFADIDEQSHNISARSAAALINSRTRAIIAVHLAGWPCDMHAITALAREQELVLIEDCAQAHGAAIDGRRVGSFGDFAAFSFCQDKIMTTGGEGGLLLCREQGAWERAWSYRDHGKDRSRASADPVAGYRYVHDGPGSNLRMLETQAAIGRLQLRRLGNWLTTRNRNAARLRQWLAEANVTVARPGPGFTHAYYRLGVTLNGNLAQRRDEIIGKMRREGAPISVGSCPALYREKVFAPFAPSRLLPATEKIATACMVLPVHPTLTDGQLDWLGASLRRVLDG